MLSDPHYFDPALGTTGEAFEEYLAGDRKLIAESEAILESAINDIKASDTEALIIPGDLTKDGELSSHQNVVDILEEVEDTTDIEVYVTHGNHDILNPIAVSYEGENEVPVDRITEEEYKDMYEELGYGQAVAQDPNSLSYAVDLDEETRLIVMDSALYEANFDEGYPQTGGAINQERMGWI